MAAALLVLLVVAATASAQTSRTWDGSSSTAWNVAANWTPSGVPATIDHVAIPNTTNKPVLSANVTVANFSITGGELDLDGHTMTVNGTMSMTGGTVKDGLMQKTTTAAVTITGVTVNCVLNIVSNTISINNSIFKQEATITKNNGGANSFNGNIWEAHTRLTNSGNHIGSSLTIASTEADTFLSHLELTSSAPGLILGNSSSAHALVLAGDGLQFLTIHSSTGLSGRRVTINKPTGYVQLTGDLVIANYLNLTKGIVEVASGGLVTVNSAATVSSTSNISHINGPVLKKGNQAFTFPVGMSGFYRPISISAPSITSNSYKAQYFEYDSDPIYSHSSKDGSIDALSRNEHWKLERISGSTNVSVTLSWDSATTSCDFDDYNDLLVTAWNGSQWKDLGNGVTTGNNVQGTVATTATSSIYNLYTLGTTDDFTCARGGSCDFPTYCNLVGNGDFEDATYCGPFPSWLTQVNCWDFLGSHPGLFSRDCIAGDYIYNVGTNTANSSPPSDTHDGSPNNNFMGIMAEVIWTPPPSTFTWGQVSFAQTELVEALQPGGHYLLSFYGKVNNGFDNYSAPIYIATSPASIFPPTANYLPGDDIFHELFPNSEPIIPNDGDWHYFSIPFTFSSEASHQNLIISYDIFSVVVAGSSATFQFFIDDISLQRVYPPELTTSPSCAEEGNGTATATPSGGATPYTYLWDSSAGSQTTQTATNLDPGIYTVTLTDANGCTSDWEVEVKLASACCDPAEYVEVENETFPFTNAGLNTALSVSWASTTGTITGKNFAVNGTWTVQDGYTLVLNDCDLSMGEDAEIIVEEGADLRITQESHLHACDDMWNRILVENGGEIRVQTNSLIEDAYTGAYIRHGAFYNISNSTFNRNYFHIINFNTALYSPTFGPGTISDTQFRCQTTASLSSATAVYTNLLPPYSSDITLAAIYAVNSDALSVSNSGFSNADYGVYTDELNDVAFSGSTMEDLTTVGLYLTEGGTGDIDIIGNTILRTPFGIFCYDNPDAELKIEDNTIDYTGIASPTDTMTAIFVAELTPGTYLAPNKVSITDNEIYLAPCGIHTMNLLAGFPSGGTGTYYVGNNTISVYQPSYTSSAHSGILLENSTLGLIVDNEVYRYDNDVNWWETAIRIGSGVANQVVCNNTHDIGKGLFFDNDQRPLTYLIRNEMENHDGGIFLNNAKIGDQGGTDNPHDNMWHGSWTGTNYSTHCYSPGSDGDDSKFYVRNFPSAPSIYIPGNNYFSNGAPVQIDIETTNGSWTNGCMYTAPSFKTEGEPEGLADAMEIVSQDVDMVSDSDIRRGMRWAGQYGLYKAMLLDEELRYGDNSLTSFFTERDNGSMGQLHRALTGFRAARGDQGMSMETATALYSLEPSGLPEERLKEVLGILYTNITDLKGIGGGHEARLRDIAQLCPIDNGFGVYMARAALLKLDTLPRMYTSECERVPQPEDAYWKEEVVAMESGDVQFQVYPNPSNGRITLSYTLNDDEIGKLSVFTMVGQQIMERSLDRSSNLVDIDLTGLSSSIYLLIVEVNGERRNTERISILRE